MGTKEKCPQGGYPASTKTKEASSELTSKVNGDYTRQIYVYKINPTTLVHVPTTLGENGSKVIAIAEKIDRMIAKNNLPLPYMFEYMGGAYPYALLECGKQFEAKRNLAGMPTVDKYTAMLDKLGVYNMTLMRLPNDSSLYVDYGRCGRVEFRAYVNTSKGGE